MPVNWYTPQQTWTLPDGSTYYAPANLSLTGGYNLGPQPQGAPPQSPQSLSDRPPYEQYDPYYGGLHSNRYRGGGMGGANRSYVGANGEWAGGGMRDYARKLGTGKIVRQKIRGGRPRADWTGPVNSGGGGDGGGGYGQGGGNANGMVNWSI